MEQEIKVNTIYGKGILYVTSNALVVIINKKGQVFERQHTQIASVEAIHNKKMKVTWPEGRELFDFSFKLKDAFTVVKEIVERHNYDDNFPDMVGVNTVILTEKEQKEIIEKRANGAKRMIEDFKKMLDEANLKLNMIASDDPDKQNKILEAAKVTKQHHDQLEMAEKYLKDIPNIVMNRSKKIPKEVPNHLCWNDCWFDKESVCYVTFNDFWNQDWYKDFDEVKKFDEKNTIPNAYAIPYALTKMKYGYPTCGLHYGENDIRDGFISYMTDGMLTDKIISEKAGFDIETVGDRLPVEIKRTSTYKISEGSKLVLKNGERYKFSRKETLFLLNRRLLPKQDIPLLP